MAYGATPDLHGLMLALPAQQPIGPVGAVEMSIVADGPLFQRLLTSSRPQLVVVFAPPATRVEIEAVATERRRRRDMRAILVDRPADTAERLAALRSGFDAAFDDTITPGELAGRLTLMAERPPRQTRSDRLIILGPELVLDTAAHELRQNRLTVHLRPREYALLEVLARHPGQTLSRRQLLEAVGARGTLGDARTVDVHIRWLRGKLAAHGPASVQLVTVRSAGYRLDTPAARAMVDDVVNRTLTNGQQPVDSAPGD